MGAGWIATILDENMLSRKGVTILGRNTPETALPVKRGSDVAFELGGRYLLRYMLKPQVGEFCGGSSVSHWVTPTPLAPADLPAYLALPHPTGKRTHVMFLDPALIPEIHGPRWVEGGKGIEYLLPHGFPGEAVFVGWEIEVT